MSNIAGIVVVEGSGCSVYEHRVQGYLEGLNPENELLPCLGKIKTTANNLQNPVMIMIMKQ